MPATAEDLVERLLEHCSHVCVTGGEGPIADAVVARYEPLGEEVERVGHSVVVGRAGGERPLVLLVGHLDVVPPTDDDREPRVGTLDGTDVVIARGASDMKAGNVVAMACFEDAELRASSPYDLALVLYAGEEGPDEGNELADVLETVPWLRDAALAVILEPTDGEVQAGCLGGLHATLTFEGTQAHSARPWHGENALTKAGAFLAQLHELAPREVEVDGITYRDVWSATQASTDNARNVIPGRFTVNLNFRFAPSRTLDEAEQELRDLVGDRAAVEIVDRAPPAPPSLGTPVLEAFVTAVDAPLAGKQAWTDVARFAQLGVPAVNYGPGLTSQAHQRGEYVPVAALEAAYHQLHRFLTRTT
ncbi:MAG: succinyl-diaminopimelate desuccinylase [Actinobacteria bacterium]|nr:succinyl-diaminopimelate desuccinylase [Actinomycetota bacterium]